jgi:hypothetical protein
VLLLLYWSSLTSTDTPASQDADADGSAAAATGEPGAKSKAKSAKTSAVVGAGSDGNDPMVLDGEATAAGTVSVGLDLLETQLRKSKASRLALLAAVAAPLTGTGVEVEEGSPDAACCIAEDSLLLRLYHQAQSLAQKLTHQQQEEDSTVQSIDSQTAVDTSGPAGSSQENIFQCLHALLADSTNNRESYNAISLGFKACCDKHVAAASEGGVSSNSSSEAFIQGQNSQCTLFIAIITAS